MESELELVSAFHLATVLLKELSFLYQMKGLGSILEETKEENSILRKQKYEIMNL